MKVPSEVLDCWKIEPTVPATPEAVARLETLCGGPLPDDYREFLLQYGYSKFDIIGASAIDARYDMNPDIATKTVFLSFISPPDGVEENLKVFASPMELADVGARIPPKMLPIGEAMAETSGLVLMQLGEKNFGSLWYWEHVDETWGTGNNTLLGALGRDLGDMLSKVREAE